MNTRARLYSPPEPLRHLAGEIQGAALLGIAAACATLHLFPPSELHVLTGHPDPASWYPLERLAHIEQAIADKFAGAAIILEKTGGEFIKHCLAAECAGPPLGSGIDFLRRQRGAKGYGQIVRGNARAVGRFELAELDLAQGRALIVSSTPFNRDFERGLIIAGMLAPGDIAYAKVDNSRDPNRFEIEFRPCVEGLGAAVPFLAPQAEDRDERPHERGTAEEALYWRYQGLLDAQRRDRAFWLAVQAAQERLIQELQETSRQMHALAHHDALTGLPNRRGILLALSQEFSRAVRYDQPLSIAILDLDWFKQVNDTHGHLAGDEVLRAAATLFAARLRLSDAIGRLGGEEFLILFPGTTAGEAGQAADKLRKALAEAQFPGRYGLFRVTASFGIAGRDDAESPVELLRRADDALYQAKATGRDRVAVHAPGGEFLAPPAPPEPMQ
jgi:diguanylate cyclase (GGDEF)-like protein